MPTNKDFKRLVRGRMHKTGESYTAARSQLLKKKTPKPVDYAALAGIADATVKEKTGCGWELWTMVLDGWNATEKSHREIAQHVHEKYKIPGWWAQNVTVGYERIKGLREIGQRRGGGFDCNKSKTFPVAVSTLYRAFSEKRRRTRWLDADVTIRTSRKNQSMRIRWEDDSPVDVYFTERGPAKSTVTIQHRGHRTRAAMEKYREFWGDRLRALQTIL